MGTIFTIPLLYTLQPTKSALAAFLLICRRLADCRGLHLDQCGRESRVVSDQSARNGRGLPYAITVSIFGGTAESIALWFKSIGHETWFYYYLTAGDRDVAAGLHDDARHEAPLGHGSA